MFTKTVLVQALLAAAAFAVPTSQDRMAKRLAERAVGGRKSLPNQRHSNGNVSHVDYSSNWSGAVLSATTATYTAVSATFIVPSPSGSSGSSASAWVGIDGDTCGTAILQTGLDFNVGSGGSVSYDAWYEWYPDFAHDFSGITFSPGDEVSISVVATSTKAGSAVIKNVTTGKSVSKSLTSTSALCQFDAEWIVEDFEEGSSLVPLADWGTVTFSSAQATTKSGSTVGPSGADIIDLKQGSTVYSSVSTTSSSVTVNYV